MKYEKEQVDALLKFIKPEQAKRAEWDCEGVEKMEKNQIPGWDDIPSGERERKPQVKWDNGEEGHTVTFKCERPIELRNKEGGDRFFLFDVEEVGEQKVVLTSAWTMLKGIKSLGDNLMDKTAHITLKKDGSKRAYEVVSVDAVVEEKIS